MGKQIRFFATQNDVDKLVDCIYINMGIVVDAEGQELDEKKLSSLADYDFCQSRFSYNKFFVTNRQFMVCFRTFNEKKVIREIESEVIEFSLCEPHPKMIIDTSPVDNNFKRGGILVINDSEEYNRQMNELMKDPHYVDNPSYVRNGFEHGRFWYEPHYYDANGSKVAKRKELSILFNALNKFVKSKFRLTADRFAYIGPAAFEKYKRGDFVPCSLSNLVQVE